MSNLIDPDAALDAMSASGKPKEQKPKEEPKIESNGSMSLQVNEANLLRRETLPEMYDRLTTRVYIFDVSGSMLEPLASEENVDAFQWETSYVNYVDHAKERISKAIEQVKAAEKTVTEYAAMGIPSTIESIVGQMVVLLATHAESLLKDDEELKRFIVAKQLFFEMGIPLKDGLHFKKRIELVVTGAKAMISKRFNDYPSADVIGIWFDNHAGVFGGGFMEEPVEIDNPDFDEDDPFCPEPAKITVIQKIPVPPDKQVIRKLSKEELELEIDGLPSRCGGGTNIHNAMHVALDAIKAKPSPVSLHHFILVTDAEDGSGQRLWEERETFKSLGICLDFIHITKPFVKRYSWDSEENANHIRQLCAFLGGEYTKVTNSTEYTTKFFEANKRKLLPAGSGA